MNSVVNRMCAQGASFTVRTAGGPDGGHHRPLERVRRVPELPDASALQVVQTGARPRRRHPHSSACMCIRPLFFGTFHLLLYYMGITKI